MNKNKNESGRSMVEMLGVLAIIGVLSIGGITGYTMSMNRYQANQIIDAANKYAFIAYNSCQQAIINNDISDITQCLNTEEDDAFVPLSYEEAGLPSISNIAEISFVGVAHPGNLVVLDLVFQDKSVCKMVESTVDSLSDPTTCSDSFLEIYTRIIIKQEF